MLVGEASPWFKKSLDGDNLEPKNVQKMYVTNKGQFTQHAR